MDEFSDQVLNYLAAHDLTADRLRSKLTTRELEDALVGLARHFNHVGYFKAKGEASNENRSN